MEEVVYSAESRLRSPAREFLSVMALTFPMLPTARLLQSLARPHIIARPV